MLPESTPVPGPGRSKYRLRFRKAGDLRLVSHHDLMHCFERMFRRASLPVPRTQGFNPRPRMWFALSLALGIVGQREVLELELTEPLSADELKARLAAQSPPGIDILEARAIDVRAGARVRRAWYRLPLDRAAPILEGEAPAEPLQKARPPESGRSLDLAERCGAFLNQPHHWVERTRPHRRRLDLRPFVSELHARPDGLEMALWVTPYGAARADEVIEALGLIHLLNDGAVLERTTLELEDELPADMAFQGGPPRQADTIEPLPADDRDRSPEEAAPRATALLPGPLSFDS